MAAKDKIPEEIKEIKTNDDAQAILDYRGYYKVGKWWVKIRRINVREMIAGWGVISQAFTQVQGLDFNWKEVGTWTMLFLVALPTVPGKFYQFLQQVMELQNTSDLKDKEFFEKETPKFSDYVRKELKSEELIDVIQVIYNQEKDRFGELARQVDFFIKPLMEMMKAEKKKQAEDLKANIGPKPST